MDFENGQIKVFFGPKGHKAPDDLEKVIVDFIDEAEESLEVAVQELDNPLIAAALERASRRHKTSKPDRRISVRIVVEANYLRESSPIPPPDPNDPNSEEKPGQFEENREKMRQLLRSAAHFKLDFNASTFHQKFIVRDYNRPKAALLTGSTNFTTTGTRSNLNNLVIFHHPDIVKAYHSEWNQINEGTFGRFSPKGYKAKELLVGNTKVYPLFAPDHNPELIIVNAILKAEKSIHFAIFTFSGSSTIDDALLSALAKGVSVKGVLDRTQASHDYSPHPALINAGAELRRHKVPGLPGFNKRGKLHHKIMVIDGKVAISGSFNYTDKANRFNDENVFFIHNQDVAECFINEIDRIYENLAEDF